MVGFVLAAIVSGRNDKGHNYEEQFYEIVSIADSYLPIRFKKDIALQTLFYAFAMVEDYYRPKRFRVFERMAARLRLAKSTGLMQVKSQKPLTDGQSVSEAIPIIEAIWDEYLEKSDALYVDGNLKVRSDSYSYVLGPILNLVYCDFSSIYSRYMGSLHFNGQEFFSNARTYVTNLNYVGFDSSIFVDSPPNFSSKEALQRRIDFSNCHSHRQEEY